MGKKSKGKKSKKEKAEVKVKSPKKEKVIKVKRFLIAKINDEFIITNKYDSHYDWLRAEKNLGRDTVNDMVLGKLKVTDRDKEIVLFTGEDKKRINRTMMQPNIILNLHNTCRDNVGVGNYKVYNGLKIDSETGKEIYISSILDFDVRKPIKHAE